MAEIDRLFQYLVSCKGSDLHLSEGQPPKVRVHGGVSPIPDEPVLEGETFKKMLEEIAGGTDSSLARELTDILLDGSEIDIEVTSNTSSAFRALRKLDIDYKIIE